MRQRVERVTDRPRIDPTIAPLSTPCSLPFRPGRFQLGRNASLECRVERRYPAALVGNNPVAARILQFAARHRIPGVQFFMNCAIRCPLGSPVLMPYPFGIVMERNVSLGSRVTVMNHASLMGEVTVEDNVVIGPGARVIGKVRIGRGASPSCAVLSR